MIFYRYGNGLDLDAVIDVYVASTIRRPTGDRELMRRMLAGANLVVSAWDDDLMVGIARAITDGCYVTYLADLAVRASHQRRGIGKGLIRRVQAEVPSARVVLLAAPAAREYYGHIGMTQHPSAWWLNPEERLRD